MSTYLSKLRHRYYLHLIQVSGSTVSYISQALLIMANKRLTLAEKAICNELHACVYWENCLIAVLIQFVQEENFVLTSTDGKSLRQINIKLTKRLQAFIQAANHGLNYLEQYFEHDFWLELSNDQPSARLSQIHIKVKDKVIS